MSVGYIFLAGLIKDAPLGSFIIEIIDTVAVVTDEGINVVLAVNGDAHDFLSGLNLFERHVLMNDR